MSFNAMTWAMSLDLPDTKCFAVLMAMANYADDAGICWPSQSTIAGKTKLARETVSRTIKKLRELGYVSYDGKAYVLNVCVTVNHRDKESACDTQSHDVTQDHNSVTQDHTLKVTGCDGGSQVCDTGSQGCDGGSHPSKPVNNQSINKEEDNQETELGFDDFWEAYPRKTGIGAARQQFTNEIMFKAAKPERMVSAAKAYAAKHEDTDEQFIQKPAKFLQDQTYLDPDLQKRTVQKTDDWPEWKQRLSRYIDKKPLMAWFEGAEVVGNCLRVQRAFQRDQILQRYSTALHNVLGKDFTVEVIKGGATA